MAIQKEVWANAIAETLHQGMQFAGASVNHDEFVVSSSAGKTVHVPRSGAAPAVADTSGRTLPESYTSRTDTIGSYNLLPLSTAPVSVPDFEEYQASYAKLTSVTNQMGRALREDVSLRLIHAWAIATATTTHSTTGSAGVLNNPSGGTNLKKMTAADVANARARVVADKFTVQPGDINMAVPSYMYPDLLEIDNFVRADAYGTSSVPSGALGQLFGITVWELPETVLYLTSSGARLALGTTPLGTHSGAAIVWHRDAVAKAFKGVKIFSEIDNPQIYGSGISAEVYLGTIQMYASEAGVTAVVQAA